MLDVKIIHFAMNLHIKQSWLIISVNVIVQRSHFALFQPSIYVCIRVACVIKRYWSLIQHFNSLPLPFNQSSDWLPLTHRRLEQLVGGASLLTVQALWLSFPL